MQALKFVFLFLAAANGIKLAYTVWRNLKAPTRGLRKAELLSLKAERDAGLVFSQLGKWHMLWDGYWEYQGVYFANSKPDYYVRPVGYTDNRWVPVYGGELAAARVFRTGRGGVGVFNREDEYGQMDCYVEAIRDQPKKPPSPLNQPCSGFHSSYIGIFADKHAGREWEE